MVLYALRTKLAEGRLIVRSPLPRPGRIEGAVALGVGSARRAREDFKKVAELNPRNLDAVREVRLHNMRTGAAQGTGSAAERSSKAPPTAEKKAGGLLGKLFKK